MKLESNGILIDIKPFGERDIVARVFTSDFGVLSGMIRWAQSAKRNKPLIGQFGNVIWGARLDSQLGSFHWESEKNLAAPLMLTRKGLEYMNSAFALISVLVPEREQYRKLYANTLELLINLTSDNQDRAYINWEISLLQELGYALDLTACSGCGTRENLEYLSPRTGRAVCKKCAEPYKDKLYKLPLNLFITRKFLESACFVQGVELPYARIILN